MPFFTLRPSVLPLLYPPSCRVISSSSISYHPRRNLEGQQAKSGKPKADQLTVAPDMSQIDATKLPHDVGLLDGTFIMPTGARKPSLLQQPSKRLGLEWQRVKTRCKDLYSILFNYKFSVARSRPRLELWHIVPRAIDMYKKMYTEVITHDSGLEVLGTPHRTETGFIKEACCEGLVNHLKRHTAVRPLNQKARWEIRSIWPHLATRVVSNRASKFPREDSAIRQVVVKIRSKQRIVQTRDSETVDGHSRRDSQWVKVIEYLVIQRRIIDGEEGDWKIWGTTPETSYDRVYKEESYRRVDGEMVTSAA